LIQNFNSSLLEEIMGFYSTTSEFLKRSTTIIQFVFTHDYFHTRSNRKEKEKKRKDCLNVLRVTANCALTVRNGFCKNSMLFVLLIDDWYRERIGFFVCGMNIYTVSHYVFIWRYDISNVVHLSLSLNLLWMFFFSRAHLI